MKLISSPLRIIPLVLGLFFLSFVALWFAFQNAIGPFSHDMLYVPDYPGAQQAQVWTEPNPDKWCCFNGPYKRVTFVTSDTPQQVFTFYKNKLRNRLHEDWRVDTAYLAHQPDDMLEIIGFGRRRISPPMYIFTVKVEHTSRQLEVTVERSVEPGI